MNIILSGAPKSTNHLYRSVCRGKFPTVYMTNDGRALKESYQWEAKSQWKKPLLTTPFKLYVDLYFDSKRKHDIDNYNKVLYDALTGIVWEDDGLIEEVRTRKFYDKNNPRIELSVLA